MLARQLLEESHARMLVREPRRLGEPPEERRSRSQPAQSETGEEETGDCQTREEEESAATSPSDKGRVGGTGSEERVGGTGSHHYQSRRERASAAEYKRLRVPRERASLARESESSERDSLAGTGSAMAR
jgi:hypothetical protein